jgi:hypothetical protein
MKVAPRGRLPSFCCQTCRQRDYERRKWTRPHAVELLARDLGTAKVRSEIQREVWAALRQLGITPPPQPPRRPATLRLVEQDAPPDD